MDDITLRLSIFLIMNDGERRENRKRSNNEGGFLRTKLAQVCPARFLLDYKPGTLLARLGLMLPYVMRHITRRGSLRSSSHNKRTFLASRVCSHMNLETRGGRTRRINLAPRYMCVCAHVPSFCFIGTLIKGSPKAKLKNNASTYSMRWCVTERPLYGRGDNWEISFITSKW